MHDTIKKDLVEAMKNKDSVRVNALRGLLAGCTNELVSKGNKPKDPITDDIALTVIKRAVKQRKDSIEQFIAGGRDDLAQDEKAELSILEHYLPQQMTEQEIRSIAAAKKTELNITDSSKLGILVGQVMNTCGGRADGTLVKSVVESLFA